MCNGTHCEFDYVNKYEYYSKIAHCHFEQWTYNNEIKLLDISDLTYFGDSFYLLNLDSRLVDCVISPVVTEFSKPKYTQIEEICVPVLDLDPVCEIFFTLIKCLLKKSKRISLQILANLSSFQNIRQGSTEYQGYRILGAFFRNFDWEKVYSITHVEKLTDEYSVKHCQENIYKSFPTECGHKEYCKLNVTKNGRKDNSSLRKTNLKNKDSPRNVKAKKKELLLNCQEQKCFCEIQHTYIISRNSQFSGTSKTTITNSIAETSPATDKTGSNGFGNSETDTACDGDACDVDAELGKKLTKAYLLKQPSHYWKLRGYSYKGAGTVIAIIDTGIDQYHPAFFNDPRQLTGSKIIAAINFCGISDYAKDEIGHGTLCAGIACGSSYTFHVECDSEISSFELIPHTTERVKHEIPSGVAPKAEIVVCKVGGSSSSKFRALRWINDNCTGSTPISGIRVDVVSYSIGSRSYLSTIEQEISKLVSAGVLVVCAASNDGHQCQQPIRYPAALGNVLCIGSHGVYGKPSEFSPIGQQIDFLAPGEDIIGPSIFTGATVASGTSYAAPAIAGLICLMLECIKINCSRDFEQELRKHCEIPDGLPVFRKHWVMKEILCNMATNPGIHLNDRGYGSIDPERFFKNPTYFIRNVLRM